jgi:hypothetical protein
MMHGRPTNATGVFAPGGLPAGAPPRGKASRRMAAEPSDRAPRPQGSGESFAVAAPETVNAAGERRYGVSVSPEPALGARPPPGDRAPVRVAADGARG